MADSIVLHGGPLLDQLVESEAMAVEATLLDVDHIEDGPWTAAKSTDNITLKHEAGVRRSVADFDFGLVPTRSPLL